MSLKPKINSRFKGARRRTLLHYICMVQWTSTFGKQGVTFVRFEVFAVHCVEFRSAFHFAGLGKNFETKLVIYSPGSGLRTEEEIPNRKLTLGTESRSPQPENCCHRSKQQKTV
ncbi:hypothetical protein CDAR_390331 [Caerostris darwini]|uniref:Uncharacterized protein n=1 Tax=Caerostris darwini TaxID=1538125 RepID=A0AAV4NZ69_9ARAC|nr:hypothetical protein CDAR_390331 [Caerostris darwini]